MEVSVSRFIAHHRNTCVIDKQADMAVLSIDLQITSPCTTKKCTFVLLA